jgi:hypothetical protein
VSSTIFEHTFERRKKEIMLVKHEPVSVRTSGSVPVDLEWHGSSYAVTDTPTPIHGNIPEAPTHPLHPRIGWRFQGTNAAGETHVFDVRQTGRHEWELVAVYD